jgi:hypothetical protein
MLCRGTFLDWSLNADNNKWVASRTHDPAIDATLRLFRGGVVELSVDVERSKWHTIPLGWDVMTKGVDGMCELIERHVGGFPGRFHAVYVCTDDRDRGPIRVGLASIRLKEDARKWPADPDPTPRGSGNVILLYGFFD